MLLTHSEIEQALRSLPGWSTDGKSLRRTYVLQNFPEAVAFVNQLVGPAEALRHHPDVAISYNCVTLSLTTHDVGGLTAKDIALAGALEMGQAVTGFLSPARFFS
jgi:4a-hydroxytetrahydrobiopterin dehydratase